MVAGVDLRITGVNASGGRTNWAGLMVRNLNATDMDTGYLVALRDNGQVFVYRSGVTLGSAAVPGYVSGQWTRLRVAARGATLTVHSGSEEDPHRHRQRLPRGRPRPGDRRRERPLRQRAGQP
ncbi:hypothetical protein GCM10020219_076050 [Nonomuraea dietziae]